MCVFILQLAAAVVLFSAVTGNSVTVRVNITRLLDGEGCNTTDLISTILVEYRQASDLELSESEWMSSMPNATLEMIELQLELQLEYHATGIQLRLLQLEHRGGLCDCWRLETLAATLNPVPNTRTPIQHSFNLSNACHSELLNTTNQEFCCGNGYEARGVITDVFNFTQQASSTVDVNCIGNSNETLFPGVIPALTEDCETETARM